MPTIYARLIMSGVKSLDDVPDLILEDVKTELKELDFHN